MNHNIRLVFVWPLSTRIIHWIIAGSFIGAFYTSFYESYLDIHVALGWIFGSMLGYRILWGFVGPRYATFNTFKFSFGALVWYFQEKIIDRWRKIPPGHNPASSWYTVIVLGLGSIIVISGLLHYGIQEGKGLFAFLNADYYMYMNALDGIHRYVSYALAAWAVVHITGVLIEQFYHKTNMLFAMITGFKKSEGEDTDITSFGRSASFLFIILSVIAFYYIVSTYDNIITRSIFPPINPEEQHRVYATDCGTCHKPYPAYLLTEKSWSRLMDGLNEHFNERITEHNISTPARSSIRNYLSSHSAEHSTREAAFKMSRSIGDNAPISTSKIAFWRETHAAIDPSVYKRPSIKSRANCAACHIDFEFGVLDDNKILIPK